MKLFAGLALSLASAVALAHGGGQGGGHGGGPYTPMPIQTCSWPAWEGCGDTTGDMVEMTCTTAQAHVKKHGAGYFTTEDGGEIGPVYKTVMCGGSEHVQLVNIRTTDTMACTVGETCVANTSGGHGHR